MRYLVTGKEMKLLDKNTSNHFHVPELVLMEQAAMHFVRELCRGIIEEKENKKEIKKGIIFCGLGNNGADGVAIARLLQERGITAEICMMKDVLDGKHRVSESFAVQESIYRAYNYPTVSSMEDACQTDYDFVIDALFGIGLSRNLEEPYLSIIEQINKIPAIKIAVDMPSGINADNGQVMGAAIKCDHTITFSFEKAGQYLWPGCDYAGKTHVVDMGITERSWLEKKPHLAYLEQKDLCNLPKRPSHSNKGTFGKLLIIAGSKEMSGAAVFAARAAYRSGVGLVKVFTCEENRAVIQSLVPEALLATYNGKLEKENLIEQIQWADAIVIGPGIGCGKIAREMVELVRSAASVPVVWDADALNILSEDINRLLLPHTEFVMTPHLGEFSRLTKYAVSWIQNHLVDSAVDFARTYDVICVLKDFHTVTADPYGLSFLNLSGNNGMATGGSGDVLSGMIGAFLAQGMKGQEAAAYAVFIHGLAGDRARTHTGCHGMMASDVIEALNEIWEGIDNVEQQSLCRD